LVVAAELGRLAAEPAVLPAAVYAELMVGLLLADTPTRAAARRAKIEALTVRVPVVDFGPVIAEEWARLFATLSRRGELIPPTTWPLRRQPGTWASACW
jgi:predicted nucleic acid-binding protein